MSAPPNAKLVMRSAFHNQSRSMKAIDLGFGLVLPAVLLAIAALLVASSGLSEARGLLTTIGLAIAMAVFGLLETRPATVSLDATEIARKDIWSVRHIALANIERVCGAETQGRLQVAVRSRAGCLLRLYDEFTEADKERLLDALGATLAPHGIAVERPPTMPTEIFGFEDTDSVRRAGEDHRRASAWAVLLSGFGFLLALLGYLLWSSVLRGEVFLVFFTPVAMLIFTFMAIGVLARRTVFFTSAMLIFGGFAIFLAAYPTFAPPFWTGPGLQTTPGPARALVLLGGIVCLFASWAITKDARHRQARSDARVDRGGPGPKG